MSSSAANNHTIDQTYQRIVSFACPACYLLFNLRDECLQHMSDKNHFTEALAMSGKILFSVHFHCNLTYPYVPEFKESSREAQPEEDYVYNDGRLCVSSLLVKEPRGRAQPVPIPQYVKKSVIASCKDVPFNVRCSLCHKVLMSHQAAQAHFK